MRSPHVRRSLTCPAFGGPTSSRGVIQADCKYAWLRRDDSKQRSPEIITPQSVVRARYFDCSRRNWLDRILP